MEPLALDPGDYSGRYKLIGGRTCLDLVNTISWPDTEHRHDWLETSANITTWLEAVGIPTEEVAEADIAEIHQIRRTLTDILRPLAHGTRPAPEAIGRFNQDLARALARRHIDPVSLTWTWTSPEDRRALDAVVLDAAEIVTSEDHSRLKACPSCDWVFMDQTRNGRRRWCDMADCGSRAKARSYYQRKKEDTSTEQRPQALSQPKRPTRSTNGGA